MAGYIPSLETFPEDVLVLIFSNLSVSELCRIARVCRRWSQIVKEKSLWQCIDLSQHRLTLNELWRIIKPYITPRLHSLKLKGYWDFSTDPKAFSWRKKMSMSNAKLLEIKDKCTNLKTLQLSYTKVDDLDPKNLPSTLQRFAVTHCYWKPKWLNEVFRENDLPLLTSLDVSGTVRFDCQDLIPLAESGLNLKELKMNGCYRVGEAGLTAVATKLQHLQTLAIIGVKLNTMTCHHIGRHLKHLTELSISLNTDNGKLVSALTPALPKLRHLNLFHSEELKVDYYLFLDSIPSLKMVVMCGDKKHYENYISELRKCHGKICFSSCDLMRY